MQGQRLCPSLKDTEQRHALGHQVSDTKPAVSAKPCYFFCLFCVGSILNCRLSNTHSCCCASESPVAKERKFCLFTQEHLLLLVLLTTRLKLSNNFHWLKPEQQQTANKSTQCILQQMSDRVTSQVQLHSFPVTKAGGQGPNYDLKH